MENLLNFMLHNEALLVVSLSILRPHRLPNTLCKESKCTQRSAE